MPGANPDTVASLVTASLERQFGQIPALASMSSQSSFGFSQITLQFELDRDIDAAAQEDVQSAINSAAATLPRDLPLSADLHQDQSRRCADLTLMLHSQLKSIRDMSDLADTQISARSPRFRASAACWSKGGLKPAIRIQADIARLAANLSRWTICVSPSSPPTPMARKARSTARGSLHARRRRSAVFRTAVETLVVSWAAGRPLMLRDVAKVVDGLENSRSGRWRNNMNRRFVLDILRQPGSNIIATVERIRTLLPQLRRQLPDGVLLDIVVDRNETIRASIAEIQFTLATTIVLVVVVVLLFLRSLSATLVAAITLPLSIVATFAVMWAAGFSLNNLSLMALTIGTGFVVDDAIVMIENIVRKIEEGASPYAAAVAGAREIGLHHRRADSLAGRRLHPPAVHERHHRPDVPANSP